MARTPKDPSTQQQPKFERIFTTSQEVIHDLFILEPAKMLKNIAIQGLVDYTPVVHQHFFHTYDSDGLPQTFCSPIGGHFHEITVSLDPETGSPIAKCSPPLIWGKKKDLKSGKFKRALIPANEDDQHTHEVSYLRSQKIPKRVKSVEAAKIQIMEAQKSSEKPGLEHGSL